MKKYICGAPNFSEGRDKAKIEAIVDEVRKVKGVKLVGYYPDADFNRTVVELIGSVEPFKEAVLNMAARSIELIDMEKQQGAHSRIGAQDTIPIHPLRNITVEECIQVAEEIGVEVNRKTGVPVFFSGENARQPERKDIAFLRKGQYEGLREILSSSNPDPLRVPDIGDAANFKHCGGLIVSCVLKPLVAVNYLLDSNDINIAKAIAKAVRGPSGGFSTVRSVGLLFTERDQAVVSMNMFDTDATPIYRTFNLVQAEAERHGTRIKSTELIGVLPQEALINVAEYYLKLENFDRGQIRENHLVDCE